MSLQCIICWTNIMWLPHCAPYFIWSDDHWQNDAIIFLRCVRCWHKYWFRGVKARLLPHLEKLTWIDILVTLINGHIHIEYCKQSHLWNSSGINSHIYLVFGTYFHFFPFQVHFDQGVSHQVPEAAAIEITVRMGVALCIVDLWEF